MAEPPAGGKEPGASHQQILRDHHQIHRLLARIESSGEGPDTRDRLAELRDLLEPHFQREESPGGLHAAVGQDAPHLLGGIDRLARDHRAILSAIDQLLEHLDRAEDRARTGRSAEVINLLRCLREHESRENRILSDSLNRDLGGGD